MLDFENYSVLTFDCYGTLIDWETGIWNALNPILRAHQIDLAPDRALELFGKLESEAQRNYQPYRGILATVLDGFGQQLGFEPTQGEREAFSGSVKDWPAFPDSARALKALKTRYKLAIVSNIDDELFAHSAQRLEVDFDEVVTAQQVQSYKPAPAHFHAAFERLGLPQDKILHVAQSLFHDIAIANSLGLTTVWVNRRHKQGGSGATPPTEARPDLEVPDLESLARMMGLL
jgi:2-haloacid dehalogenase